MQNYDFKKQPVLLIQGAMDTETEYLIGQLDEPEEIICGNWKFYTGFLGKHAGAGRYLAHLSGDGECGGGNRHCHDTVLPVGGD